MKIEDKIPLVSICCLTYNHVEYIRDAIESFLMQKTTFPIEILIYDDASTDGTAEIIREYEKKYPNLIFPIYQQENQWSKGNSPGIINRQRAKGKYLAYCEGDDYWTDSFKLQKQVDFLEAHPDYGMVHTDFDEFAVKTGVLTKNIIRSSKTKLKYQQDPDFVKWSFSGLSKIITCTVCFRKCITDQYLDENDFNHPDFPKNADMVLFSTISCNSKVKYFDESTAYKRRLMESVSQSQNYLTNIQFSIAIANANEYFAKKFNIPLKYTKKVKKRTAKRMLYAGIVNRDYDLFKKGLIFKNVKWFFMEVAFYKLLYALYPKFKGIKNVRRIIFK